MLDECHKAKNLVPTGSSKPTKTGLAVLELQSKLPKARVVYCSATGMGTNFTELSFTELYTVTLLVMKTLHREAPLFNRYSVVLWSLSTDF